MSSLILWKLPYKDYLASWMFDKLMFSKHILLWHSPIPNFVQKSVATRTDKENWNCFLISAVSLHHAYLCCIWDNVFPILQELLRSFLSWDPFDQSQRVTVGRHFQHLCTGTQRKEKLASCCRLDEVDVCRNKLSNICIPTVIVDIWRINLPLFFPEEVLKLRCYLNTQGIGIFLYIRYLPHAWGVHSRLSLLLLTEPWFAFACSVGCILGFSIVSWFPVFVEGEKEFSISEWWQLQGWPVSFFCWELKPASQMSELFHGSLRLWSMLAFDAGFTCCSLYFWGCFISSPMTLIWDGHWMLLISS